MKKRIIITSLIMALIIGVFHTPSAHAAPVTNTTQNGISIQARSNTDFASDTFKQSVDNAINKAGVNYITLVVAVHQTDRYTNNVAIDSNTPTDASIKAGADYIHAKGAKVAIAVHDDLYDGWWRALIEPSLPSVWFSNYGAILNHYATLAQSAGIEEYSLGTEMVNMTKSNYTNNWISMIQSVRTLYSGALTYSAQHYGGNSDAQTLGFWSYLDYIGLSAYYPLDGATSKTDMLAQWKKWDQLEIAPLAAKYNKPILFIEVGFVSRDGATVDPATGYNLNTSINTTLQATAYDALFEYFHNSSTVRGMFMWDWLSDPNAGGLSDGYFTPQNKPAQDVMKQWFTQFSTPVTPGVYSAKAVTPAATKNTQVTSTVTVTTPYTTADALVDVEIYNANGQRVTQDYREHQTLNPNGTDITVKWTPTDTGTYTIKTGIFSANWQSNLYWNDAVSKVNVTDAPVVVTPPTTTPPVVTPPAITPPTTTPPVVTPPVTTPPTLPTAVTIWWPSNGSTVSGVQPFKATIDGRDLNTYDMYWQVGDGQLNKMNDNTDGGAHKEASVDLSGWHWAGDHKYVITFVAKDKSGNVVSTKSTTIYIN